MGFLAKKVLLLGEKVAVKYANEVIVISEVINNMIKQKYGRDDAHLIYNGVNLSQRLTAEVINQTLARFSLQPQNYLVAVGRFVEEKACTILSQPIGNQVSRCHWFWLAMPIIPPRIACS